MSTSRNAHLRAARAHLTALGVREDALPMLADVMVHEARLNSLDTLSASALLRQVVALSSLDDAARLLACPAETLRGPR